MGSISVFEAPSVQAYLKDRLDQLGRGARNRLAKALPVHNAYITQVLSGKAFFSLEQIQKCNEFLGHGEVEARFFICLASRDRAGSSDLRAHFESELRRLREEYQELNSRLSFEKSLSVEEQLRYYESWLPSALHIAITIKKLRTVDALSDRLMLPRSRILKSIDTLTKLGLVRKKGEQIVPTTKSLHAARWGPVLKQHHCNWRLKAIDSMEREKKSELHYTSVISLAASDVEKLREIMVNAIESIRTTVAPSEEEVLCCYLLDLFEV